jgi:HEAT repeat protein
MNHRARALVVLLAVSSMRGTAGEPPYPFIDSPMYQLPDLPKPGSVTVFPEEVIKLWLKALGRPEADLRYHAAATIAVAHRRGMKGLEATVAPLRAQLDRAEQHPNVRLAAARSLVTLDAKEAAPSFFEQAKSGTTELREVLEPALARWDYKLARALWLDRLRDPAAPHRPLVLAMRALAAVGEHQADDRLHEIALAPRGDPSTRVEAARALAVLRPAGLEKEAAQLAKDTSRRGLVERLVAAALLSRHASQEAIALLQRLAGDAEPPVAALAVARLLEIDEKLALGVLESLLKSHDAKLRSLGVEILRRQPSEKHLRLLADRLDDDHPDVRQAARRGMEGLGEKKELRTPVIAEGMRILQTGRWQGLEQATILLTHLDHKPAAPRMVELIWEGRPEVFVTAAWGVRRLAVPDTLQGVLWYVTNETELLRGLRRLPNRGDVTFEMIDHQLSQLNQFLGQWRYKPAEKVLRRFVPRQAKSNMPEARASGIWALGMLLEGKPDARLARQLAERLDDIGSMPPEDERVRYMAAITIGRMKAKSELAMVRKYNEEGSYVHFACAWAVNQITGEPMPKAKTGVLVDRNWFLRLID